MREDRALGPAPDRRGQRRDNGSTSRQRERAFMADLTWHLGWLENGHEHWWLRELRWRRHGRIS